MDRTTIAATFWLLGAASASVWFHLVRHRQRVVIIERNVYTRLVQENLRLQQELAQLLPT
jgi:hypothetical protein